MARKKVEQRRKAKPALRPSSGFDTKEQIEAELAAHKTPRVQVTHLPRTQIRAAKQGVFQWRCFERNPYQSERHIHTLAKALADTEAPFDPLLVFQVGEKFYVVDGHHRLAAYEAVDWKEPVPVKVFDGSLEEAMLAGLRGNYKDKLPLTVSEKMNAAWRMVKAEQQSKMDTVKLTCVSRTTVDTMRGKWREIKAAEPDPNGTLHNMDWEHARSWEPGKEEVKGDPDWHEKRVDALIKRLAETGIAEEFMKGPDIAAEALLRLRGDIPGALVQYWGPDVIGNQEWHQDEGEDMTF